MVLLKTFHLIQSKFLAYDARVKGIWDGLSHIISAWQLHFAHAKYKKKLIIKLRFSQQKYQAISPKVKQSVCLYNHSFTFVANLNSVKKAREK